MDEIQINTALLKDQFGHQVSAHKREEELSSINIFNNSTYEISKSECKKDSIFAQPATMEEIEEKTQALKEKDTKAKAEATSLASKKRTAQLKSPTSTTSRVDIPYAGTAEDLDKILAKTPMKGCGKAFMKAQNEHGVNALFLMSIAKSETGYGATQRKKTNGKKYNAFGLTGKKGIREFNNFEESIDALGKNIKTRYLQKGKYKITEISHGGYSREPAQWDSKITKGMNSIKASIRKNDVQTA
ncbi:glucosaminidase domain-containing protein [bacterium]|nr:glucosaminidase domain-containing protein [bacterium]